MALRRRLDSRKMKATLVLRGQTVPELAAALGICGSLAYRIIREGTIAKRNRARLERGLVEFFGVNGIEELLIQHENRAA